MRRARVHRIARLAAMVAAAWCVALGTGVTPAGAEPSKGLSLTQIRGVMRAHARKFNACLTASRRNKPLHGPFVYQIEVDRRGKVLSARPYQPSGVVAFDRCVTGVLMHATFPGGPASVETALVFDAD